jgi:acetyl esterase/lipase
MSKSIKLKDPGTALLRHIGVLLFVITLLPFGLLAQDTLDLYSGQPVPNAKQGKLAALPAKPAPGMVYRVIRPSLEIYLPAEGTATGVAVIICPGGSYKVLTYAGEGIATAKAFAKRGVTAFVLKYRLPDDAITSSKTIAPLQDAQRAIKIVREGAAQWHLNPHKIGVAGFSAGGHLASTLATHYRQPVIENSNNTNLRPDFLVLVYPVISMLDSLTHADSRRNLLGDNPTDELKKLYSNNLQVDAETPPTYITHAADDKLVDVDNAIVFFESLRHHKVPVEMHIYPKGGHGFIFGMPDWTTPLFTWMQKANWISK